MVATNGRTVTVFGGTGFLGRRVVRHLREREFSVRIASRHPDRMPFGVDDPQLETIEADIHDKRSVVAALAGAYGVVNAVSLYVEHGRETFHSVHVESAQRVASAPGWSQKARSHFRNRRRCGLTITLHSKARRRRTGGASRVRRDIFYPPGGDVRTG